MTFLSNKNIELCHVPYRKSTWSYCVICPGRAKSPTYFPSKSMLFSLHRWWTFQLRTPQAVMQVCCHPSKTHYFLACCCYCCCSCVSSCFCMCVCVCVFEGIHMVGAGNSWGGVYWTGCHSTWKIWRHQLATWGKRTASTQLGSILGLIVFEASIEELESSGSSPDSSSMKGGRRRPS